MKDFDAARRERSDEPIQFTLGGETWTCASLYPAGRYFEVMPDDGRTPLMPFLAGCMTEDEFERFNERTKSVNDPIDTADVVELVTWLIGEYAARPTKRSNPSSAGPLNGGVTSKPEPVEPVPATAGV